MVEFYWLFKAVPGAGSVWNYGLVSSKPCKLKILRRPRSVWECVFWIVQFPWAQSTHPSPSIIMLPLLWLPKSPEKEQGKRASWGPCTGTVGCGGGRSVNKRSAPLQTQQQSPAWDIERGESKFANWNNTAPSGCAHARGRKTIYTEKVPALVPDWSNFTQMRNQNFDSLISPIGSCTDWLESCILIGC